MAQVVKVRPGVSGSDEDAPRANRGCSACGKPVTRVHGVSGWAWRCTGCDQGVKACTCNPGLKETRGALKPEKLVRKIGPHVSREVEPPRSTGAIDAVVACLRKEIADTQALIDALERRRP